MCELLQLPQNLTAAAAVLEIGDRPRARMRFGQANDFVRVRAIWAGEFGAVLFFFPLFLHIHMGVHMYVRVYRSCIRTGIGRNGILEV